MNWARATQLIAGGLARNETDQAEDFSHGDSGPDLAEANAWHVRRSQDAADGRRGQQGVSRGRVGTREEEPVAEPRGQAATTMQINILTDCDVCGERCISTWPVPEIPALPAGNRSNSSCRLPAGNAAASTICGRATGGARNQPPLSLVRVHDWSSEFPRKNRPHPTWEPLRRNSGVSVWPAQTEKVGPSLAVTNMLLTSYSVIALQLRMNG